jgi:penicillin amidase
VYLKESQAACLFEEIYSELMEEVFGKGLFGVEAWRHLVAETSVVVDFYHIFDKVLLGNEPSWFGPGEREQLVQKVVERVLKRFPNPNLVPSWASRQRFMMTNIFFQGKLHRFAGFDYGPIVLNGSRATIAQAVIYKSNGRTTTRAQSFRFITDLATSEAHTVIAGGPSDRRFSEYYASDIRRWLNCKYKVLAAGDEARSSPARCIDQSPLGAERF